MKRRYLYPLLLAGIIFSVGCSKKNDIDPKEEQRAHLYRELRDTYKSYANSLSNLEDSADIFSIIEKLDKKIWDIYSKYPNDLDLTLSEAENDTLWHYVSLISKYRSHYRVVMPTDTVRTDTIEEIDTSVKYRGSEEDFMDWVEEEEETPTD